MDALNLDPELEARLTAIVAETGKTKVFHIEAALADYLDDLEDQALAEEGMRDYDPAQNVLLDVVKRDLGLDS